VLIRRVTAKPVLVTIAVSSAAVLLGNRNVIAVMQIVVD
jgi:hypothetical protein